MPQCKKDFCRERAVPNAPKQYCRAHLDEYLSKRYAFRARQADLPDCPGPDEGQGCPYKAKVQRKPVYHGMDTQAEPNFALCGNCRREDDKRAAEAQEERRKVDLDRVRLSLLNYCDSVEDLRQWIKDYVL